MSHRFALNPDKSHYDYRVYTRMLVGRLTPKRVEIVERWAKDQYFGRANCGHEYDCCGCHCSRHVGVVVRPNGLLLTLADSFNY